MTPTDGTTPPLVDTDWVARHLDDPDVILLDVREEAAQFYTGHIPGARPVDWIDDLHQPVRRGFVGAGQLAAFLASVGAGNDTHLVLYGDAHNAFAASAYWLLRYHQHRRLSLVDGGITAWRREGRPLTVETEVAAPGHYDVDSTRPEIRATRDDMLTRFAGSPPGATVIDCRSSEEYDGTGARGVDLPIERHRVPGHIPGASNLDAIDLLDPETERFLPLDELRTRFRSRGAVPDVEVALYCRIAERSSLLWFALHELLGHPRVRNYDGGWAEYGSLIDAPVTR